MSVETAESIKKPSGEEADAVNSLMAWRLSNPDELRARIRAVIREVCGVPLEELPLDA